MAQGFGLRQNVPWSQPLCLCAIFCLVDVQLLEKRGLGVLQGDFEALKNQMTMPSLVSHRIGETCLDATWSATGPLAAGVTGAGQTRDLAERRCNQHLRRINLIVGSVSALICSVPDRH